MRARILRSILADLEDLKGGRGKPCRAECRAVAVRKSNISSINFECFNAYSSSGGSLYAY